AADATTPSDCTSFSATSLELSDDASAWGARLVPEIDVETSMAATPNIAPMLMRVCMTLRPRDGPADASRPFGRRPTRPFVATTGATVATGSRAARIAGATDLRCERRSCSRASRRLDGTRPSSVRVMKGVLLRAVHRDFSLLY